MPAQPDDGPLDRGVLDGYHLVDVRLGHGEREVARPHRQQPVGDAGGRLERHRAAGRQRRRHAGRAGRLDANDPRRAARLLDGGRDARQQAAAADRHVDARRIRRVLHDLAADSSLSRDDRRMVEGWDHRQPAPRRFVLGPCTALGRRRPLEQHLRTVGARAVDLDGRGGVGHDDDGRNPARAGRAGDRLRMVPGGVRDHAAANLRGGQAGDHAGRAAVLERAGHLQVFALEQQRPTGLARDVQQRGADDGRSNAGRRRIDIGGGDDGHVPTLYCDQCWQAPPRA